MLVVRTCFRPCLLRNTRKPIRKPRSESGVCKTFYNLIAQHNHVAIALFNFASTIENLTFQDLGDDGEYDDVAPNKVTQNLSNRNLSQSMRDLHEYASIQ